MSPFDRTSLATAFALAVTAGYSTAVWFRSDALSGSDEPTRGVAPSGASAPVVLAAAPSSPEPLAARSEEPLPAAPSQEAAPAIRTAPARPERQPSQPATTRRSAERSLRGVVASASPIGVRLAAIDRSAAALDVEDRAFVLARALEATPSRDVADARVREALVERLAPLADVAPARQSLVALVELSDVREERLAALRALGRGPAPLSVEARASVRAATRSSDPLVALEAQNLLIAERDSE